MPFQKPVLSLEEARRAMDRMLQEAQQKFQNRPLAIAMESTGVSPRSSMSPCRAMRNSGCPPGDVTPPITAEAA